MSRRRESCFPAPGNGHSHSASKKKVYRFSRRQAKLCPGPGKAVSRGLGSCFPAPGRLRLFPGAEEKSHSFIIKGKCVGCPGAEKQLSRRRGKVTFIHYGRKMCMFSRRQGKLCPGSGQEVSRGRGSCVPAPGKLFPGAGEKSHSSIIKRKCVIGCHGAEKQLSWPGKVTFTHYRRKMCRFSRRRGKHCPGAGKAVSRRRGMVHLFGAKEKCVGLPGAKGSCVPVPGKLFPGAGEAVSLRPESCFPALRKSHIHYRRKMCRLARRQETAVPAPGKGHIHSLPKKNL